MILRVLIMMLCLFSMADLLQRDKYLLLHHRNYQNVSTKTTTINAYYCSGNSKVANCKSYYAKVK